MPDQPSIDAHEKAFIPRELRPSPADGEEDPAPIEPDTPHSELRRRAAEVLGPALCERLGLSGGEVPIEPGNVCTRQPDVIWSAVDHEAVLLHLTSGYYFSLNQVGTVIWDLLDGTRTLGEIHGAICRRFAVEPQTAWADIEVLVRRLCADKLATLEAPSRG